jgi:hypothetical protein
MKAALRHGRVAAFGETPSEKVSRDHLLILRRYSRQGGKAGNI